MDFIALGRPICAYIDPGTGSMIIQLLLGGVAGVWVILKLYGKKILAFFGKEDKEESVSE